MLHIKHLFMPDVLALLTHLPLDKIAANLADDIFNAISRIKKYYISIRISLKFVPKRPINNSPALFQVMVWRRTGAEQVTQFTDAYLWHLV